MQGSQPTTQYCVSHLVSRKNLSENHVMSGFLGSLDSSSSVVHLFVCLMR